jgi:superfamily II DNA helicase RecQ
MSDATPITYSPSCEVNVPDDERDRLVQLARRHFGYDDIRDYQIKAAYAMLQGIDSSIILGTGAGKSLCYALAALSARDRKSLKKMVIVVSPLIALMKDQVCTLPALAFVLNWVYGT